MPIGPTVGTDEDVALIRGRHRKRPFLRTDSQFLSGLCGTAKSKAGRKMGVRPDEPSREGSPLSRRTFSKVFPSLQANGWCADVVRCSAGQLHFSAIGGVDVRSKPSTALERRVFG